MAFEFVGPKLSNNQLKGPPVPKSSQEDYGKDDGDDYEEYYENYDEYYYGGEDSEEDNVNGDVYYDNANHFGQHYGWSEESNESEEYEYVLWRRKLIK